MTTDPLPWSQPRMRCTTRPVFGPPGASGGPDATDHVNVPTLDQVRAARVRLDHGGPTVPLTPVPDPFDTDPAVRAAKAIRAALETRGVHLDTGTLLAAGEAAAVELDRVDDHVHHWQAWRDRQHPHVFVDACDTAASCPVHHGAAA